MATFKEIVDRNNRQLEQEFDNQLYVDWINDCLDELAKEVYLPTRATISEVGGVFTLPTNYKSDLQVRVVGDQLFSLQVAYDEPVLQGYVLYGEEIFIRNRAGVTQLELLYNRTPNKITNNPTEVPDIPESFHYVLEAFCRKKAMLLIEDIASDERYNFYESEYQAGKQNLISYFAVRKSSNSASSGWKVVR